MNCQEGQLIQSMHSALVTLTKNERFPSKEARQEIHQIVEAAQRYLDENQVPAIVLPKPVTVLLGAYATTDYGTGPAYALLKVDTEFASLVQRLSGICRRMDLDQVSVTGSPTRWDAEDLEQSLRLQLPALIVTKTDFYFQDHPKHQDYDIETRAMPISMLLDAVTEPGVKFVVLTDNDGAIEAFEEDCDEEVLEKFVIQSKSEDGFWSNVDGWGSLASATQFCELYDDLGTITMPMSSGSDAALVKFSDVEEESTAGA